MLDLLTVIAAIVGVLLIASLVGSIVWHPERNIDRGDLAHWFKSLMRCYADRARILIRHRSSPITIEVVHEQIHQGTCCLIVRVPSLPWSEPHAAALQKAALLDRLVSLSEDAGVVLSLSIHIPNIWSPSSADVAAQVVNRILDILGVGPLERFDLKFLGKRSVPLTKETYRRLGPGQW